LLKPLRAHGKKGFVIPRKSFVEVGITKIFCYINKMFGSINKTFGCCGKTFGCSNKSFIVPNSVAVTKPFFSVRLQSAIRSHRKKRGKKQEKNTFSRVFFDIYHCKHNTSVGIVISMTFFSMIYFKYAPKLIIFYLIYERSSDILVNYI